MRMLCVAVSVALATLAGGASAQEASRDPAELEEARALFVAGSAAVEAGRWADAVRSFERAYELTHAPSALYNLALALRALGRHREARDAFDRLLTAHDLGDDALVASAREMRDAEAARIAVLTLLGLDPDARHSIRFDGRDVADVGARPMEIESDAGAHTLVAELEGRERFLWEGELADGARETVRVVLPELGAGSSAPGDDTALHVILVVSAIVAAGVAASVIGYVVYEDSRLRPLYPQRVDL